MRSNILENALWAITIPTLFHLLLSEESWTTEFTITPQSGKYIPTVRPLGAASRKLAFKFAQGLKLFQCKRQAS